jgi:hypothetical protein
LYADGQYSLTFHDVAVLLVPQRYENYFSKTLAFAKENRVFFAKSEGFSFFFFSFSFSFSVLFLFILSLLLSFFLFLFLAPASL